MGISLRVVKKEIFGGLKEHRVKPEAGGGRTEVRPPHGARNEGETEIPFVEMKRHALRAAQGKEAST